MNVTEWEESLARNPLAVRLARVEHPPASAELMARMLSGAHAIRARRVRGRHVLLAAAGVVVALSTVAATPAGTIIGQAVQQRFGIMVGAPETLQRPGPNECAVFTGPSGRSPNTAVTTFTRNGVAFTKYTRKCEKGQTASAVTFRMPVLDLEHAQSLVSFRIRTASWVPPGLQLEGVGMYPKPPDFSSYADKAAISYRPVGTSTGPNITIDEQRGTPFGGSGVPSSAPHTVRVNGHPAVYVHGNYESSGTSNPRWNPNADVEELSWQADGLTYDIRASDLHLSERDMIRIADSVG
jgi:hypothetical protein